MKTVKVEIEVPECVVKFLKDLSAFTGDQVDLEKDLEDYVVGGLIADLNGISGGRLIDLEKLKQMDKLEDC